MGIPKFFRFISERWPLISQLIDEQQIPEFDNLYLDMNSILHNCTHSNDDDTLNRMTDDQMYASIFAYIEHLFELIRPQKGFFMAIDGVAPRAKMNQQRARRFRTAQEAEENLQRAIKNGEKIPKEDPFDSNCITPGTEFMAKLSENLRYFVHKKISEDSNWANIEIVLSGHEVPGEGEHKIMDYIRTMRSQPNYDPNVRHCIYGLDADLIMLGLVTHDPHFALLREEVSFGPSRLKKTGDVNDQKFFLLHLLLLREYLALEFADMSNTLTFEYLFDRVLDDFILIMYVIGNDFLPNLPDLFINKGAFPLLIATFKLALKLCDGYINEGGKINLPRLGVWLRYLSEFELENFEQQDVDLEWFNKKLDNISITGEKKRLRDGRLLILKAEKKLASFIGPWLLDVLAKPVQELIDLETQDKLPLLLLPAEEVELHLEFLKDFAVQVGIVIVHSQSRGTYEAKLDVDGLLPYETEDERQSRYSDIRKVLAKYRQANMVETEELLVDTKDIYDKKFVDWKDHYYKDKLHFSIHDTDEILALTKHYVEGLQWVLYYYYQGCSSWNWYYRYHYAPRISDICVGLDALIELGEDIKFDLSTPFKPFQQLMAVLPARSRQLMPAVYRPLMTDEKSPIIDFYPHEVEVDQNGKTASWEAVILLDFVDEKRLVEAMAPIDAKLDPADKKRNSLGEPILFIYNPQTDHVYPSSLPGFFHDIEHDKCQEVTFELPMVDEYRIGLLEGARTGREMSAGFPTLFSIPFDYELMLNEVKVFNFPSKSESMILTIEDTWKDFTPAQFAEKYLNKNIYSRWPFLRESKVVRVVTEHDVYETAKSNSYGGKRQITSPLDAEQLKQYKMTCSNMVRSYDKSSGVRVGPINAVIHVQPVNGLIKNARGALVKTYAREFEVYPMQLVVHDIVNKDARYATRPPIPIHKEFPIDSQVIFLGDMAYGAPAQVAGYDETNSKLSVKVSQISSMAEPTIGRQRKAIEQRDITYYPSFEVSKQIRMHPLLLSKITGSFLIEDDSKRNNPKVNIGLELKFEAKGQKVLGYTKKLNQGKVWGYSSLAVTLITEYRKAFPALFERLLKCEGKRIPKLLQIGDALELQKVRKWLKLVKADLIPVSLDSELLTKFSFEAIERFLEEYTSKPQEVHKKDIKGVPRDAVFNPRDSYKLLSGQYFNLGDRVLYVQDFGKVPNLLKGTVVSITTVGSHTSLGVIFDHPLLSGHTMQNKLRTKRGMVVDSSLVLNISDRQFLYHSKASKSKKPISQEEQIVRAQAAEAKRAYDANKAAEAQQLANQQQSHELLGLLKRGEAADSTSEDVGGDIVSPAKGPVAEDDTKTPSSTTEETYSAPDPRTVHQVFGQIYSNVMSDGNANEIQAPPMPFGAGPGALGGPSAPGYGIPVVPGIPLPQHFFMQQQQQQQAPPPPQFNGNFVPPPQGWVPGARRGGPTANFDEFNGRDLSSRGEFRGRGRGGRGGRGSRGGRGGRGGRGARGGRGGRPDAPQASQAQEQAS